MRERAIRCREIDSMGWTCFTLMVLAVAADPAVERLYHEVRTKGWVVFSARSDRGDWDLFACRPGGSERRNLTQTPDSNEAAPQCSRDGTRLLYRRLPI